MGKEEVPIREPKNIHLISFNNDGKTLGSFDIMTGEFTGNIQESAKIFFDSMVKMFRTDLSDAVNKLEAAEQQLRDIGDCIDECKFITGDDEADFYVVPVDELETHLNRSEDDG